MGSSNKHWPSMFKKSNNHNSQYGIGSSLLSTGCHGDEKTPEPKPRWNPKPEQIRILETIFNSGMMNPPREEIKQIRKQLQEYGPIGEANVFYWFQNRKSRSKIKQKQRHPNNRNLAKRKPQNYSTAPNNNNSIISAQTHVETDFQLPTPPFFSFPNQFSNMTQQLPQQNVHVPSLFNDEIFMNCGNRIPMNEQYDHEATMNIFMQQEDPQLISLGVPSNSLNDDSTLPPLPSIVIDAPNTDPFSITQFQGVGEANDVGPFNICQNFGNEVVLIDSSGQTILADECGIIDSLQHDASYYLV